MRVSEGRVYKHGRLWYYDVYINKKRITKSAGETKGMALEALAARKTDARRGEFGFINESKILFED